MVSPVSRIDDRLAAIGARAADIVDIAGVALVEGDRAERDIVGEGQVDHALELAAPGRHARPC